jgi:hypothetical protein
MEDLFETPEKIPHDIQKIIDKMNAELESGADMYKVMSKALIDCEKRGYTFEYGLDGVAHSLRQI